MLLFDWLFDYNELVKRIDYLEDEISSSKRELRRWESGDLRNVKLSKDSIASGLEKNIKDLEHEYLHQKKLLSDFKKNVCNIFDDLESRVVYLKYIEGKTLLQISIELCYSDTAIRKIHAKVAKELKKFEKEYYGEEGD